jgi:hypothetical protein
MNSLVLTFKQGKPTVAGVYLVKTTDCDMTWDIDMWCKDFGWLKWCESNIIEWAELP